jgi:hypothetical protein
MKLLWRTIDERNGCMKIIKEMSQIQYKIYNKLVFIKLILLML